MEKEYRAINVGGGASSPTDPQLENRVSELERDTAHMSKDITDLLLDKADKDQLNAYQTKHVYIEPIYTEALFRWCENTPNVVDGQPFKIEIKNDIPQEAINRGFPSLLNGSVAVGWYFINDLGDAIINLQTEHGDYKITDGSNITCKHVHDIELSYSTTGVPSKVQLNKEEVALIPAIVVWFDFPYDGSMFNTSIKFRPIRKTTAPYIVGYPLPTTQTLGSDIVLRYEIATGIVSVERADRQPTSSNIVIVDVKGTRNI